MMKYYLTLFVVVFSLSGCAYYMNPRQEAYDRARTLEMNQDFIGAQNARSNAYALPERERRHYIPLLQNPRRADEPKKIEQPDPQHLDTYTKPEGKDKMPDAGPRGK